MDNVIQISKAIGFTRMDNSIMESLATVEIPAREMRVVMAVARLTIGYRVESKRITADELGKLTNLRRDVVSKAISHLLERRILFRVGGSRGEIGISPSSEWVFYEEKRPNLSETKTSHSDHIVSLRKDASETKTATCFIYRKKDNILPSEEVVTHTPEAKLPVKSKPRKASSTFGLPQMLADNPHAIPEQLIQDWAVLRKQKRATLSATVWTALNTELTKCVDAGITAQAAMTEALVAGWQGFKAEWVANRLKPAGNAPMAGDGYDSTSTDWLS